MGKHLIIWSRENVFESVILHFFIIAGIAQLVEHRVANAKVAGSSPVSCSIYFKGIYNGYGF